MFPPRPATPIRGRPRNASHGSGGGRGGGGGSGERGGGGGAGQASWGTRRPRTWRMPAAAQAECLRALERAESLQPRRRPASRVHLLRRLRGRRAGLHAGVAAVADPGHLRRGRRGGRWVRRLAAHPASAPRWAPGRSPRRGPGRSAPGPPGSPRQAADAERPAGRRGRRRGAGGPGEPGGADAAPLRRARRRRRWRVRGPEVAAGQHPSGAGRVEGT